MGSSIVCGHHPHNITTVVSDDRTWWTEDTGSLWSCSTSHYCSSLSCCCSLYVRPIAGEKDSSSVALSVFFVFLIWAFLTFFLTQFRGLRVAHVAKNLKSFEANCICKTSGCPNEIDDLNLNIWNIWNSFLPLTGGCNINLFGCLVADEQIKLSESDALLQRVFHPLWQRHSPGSHSAPINHGFSPAAFYLHSS